MAATDGSDKMTPEALARLPPKLRARLLKRGILKEEHLMAPAEPKAPSGSPGTPPEPAVSDAAPGTPPEPSKPALATLASHQQRLLEKMAALAGTKAEPEAPTGGLGTPPEPEAETGLGTPPEPDAMPSPGTPPEETEAGSSAIGALCKAAALPPGALAKAPPPAGALCKAAAPPPGALAKAPPAVGSVCKAASILTSAVAMNLQGDLANLQEKRRLAFLNHQALDVHIEGASQAAKPKMKAAPVKQVYSSAPMLKGSAEAEKRKAEEPPAGEADAKRQELVSPANLRAAAAKAEAAAVPVWVYKDGAVTDVSPQAAGMQASVQAAAAGANFAAVAAAAMAMGGQHAAAATMAAMAAAPAPVVEEMPPPPGPPPPTGPPLPPGWVAVAHEGDYYYWNTTTQEVSWDHPLGPKTPAAKEAPKEVFKEEHRILWSDLGKVIGRQGINLKIIKESIGCQINVPRDNKGKGKGKGKDGKDKGKKGKAKGPPEGAIVGAGDGKTAIPDDAFVTVSITADNGHAARGGKRCLEVMLGYGRTVERALEALGVETKYPKLLDETPGGSSSKPKDEVDPMDPSSYSDAPQGNWGSGMKKPGARNEGGGSMPEPRDAKSANAERC